MTSRRRPCWPPATSYNVGDLDRDNLVDVGEIWLYRASATVGLGQYVNAGLVTVRDPAGGTTATASDLAHYFGTPIGAIQVVKAVNAVKPLAPTATEDANNPAAPVVLPAGSTVTFTYAVRTRARCARHGDADRRRRHHRVHG